MLPFSYDWLALGAAACWATTSLISAPPARHLGAFAFTRWRMSLVFVLLLPVVLWTGGWQRMDWAQAGALAVSGLVGIFVGDTALFAAMNRLGPRRTGVLFATHALFSAFLGFLLLDERMGWRATLGGALVVGGVMTAVAWGSHKDESHTWETLHGHRGLGVSLALLAALRVAATCVAHLALLWAGFAPARALQPPTPQVLARVAFSGLIGMGLGMSLVLLALQHGDVGMVGILSSVSPVLVLPLLWWRLGRAPAHGAWVGAVLTVLGTVLVLAR